MATERLSLKPATVDDLDAMHLLWTDPLVRRCLLDGMVVARSWTADQLESSRQTFAECGYGLWMVRKPGEAALLGACGLRPALDGNGAELLYALLPMAWGQGYATEAARAVTEYAMGELAEQRIVAGVDEGNAESIRVLQRLGFEETGRTAGVLGDVLNFALEAPGPGQGAPRATK